MDEMKKHPPTKEHLLKYGILIAVFIVTLTVVLLVGIVVQAKASETIAEEQPDYYQLYQDALAKVDVAEQMLAEKENEYVQQSEQIIYFSDELANAKQEIIVLSEQLAAAEQEKASLIAKYGTTYYVQYEIRRTDILDPEAILRITTIVTEDTYNSTEIGIDLPIVTEQISLPSSNFFTQWTATAVKRDATLTWDPADNPS